MLDLKNQEIVRELRLDVKFRHLEHIFKEYLHEVLDEREERAKQQRAASQPLLTINDIAKKFKVSKATVHNWMNKGSITGQKFGKNRYFTEEEVQKSMAKFGYSKQWDNQFDD
jgi:excisionase family DNA binding protein